MKNYFFLLQLAGGLRGFSFPLLSRRSVHGSRVAHANSVKEKPTNAGEVSRHFVARTYNELDIPLAALSLFLLTCEPLER